MLYESRKFEALHTTYPAQSKYSLKAFIGLSDMRLGLRTPYSVHRLLAIPILSFPVLGRYDLEGLR